MKISTCRICKSTQLSTFFDLGLQPLANSFLKKEELNKPESKYPLQVCFCNNCNLCQLTEVVSPEILFKNYVYFSSKMPRLPEHFRLYAEEVCDRFIISKHDLVVEIGSNDGVLLNEVRKDGVRVLGIDPAVNIAKVANACGIKTIPDFFSENLANEIVKKYGHVRTIIGNNVVAHINDHHDLVKGVKNLLTGDGVFIFEAPYLVDMFENLSFDTIYHEHLSYLAIRPLKVLFEQFGMEIFDVKVFPVQGNSIRVYAGNKGKHSIFKSVSELVNKEKEMGLDRLSTYRKLVRKIVAVKESVVERLNDLNAKGKKVAGYGAPAKGNTLLNFYGIDSKLLGYVTEELPSKVGFYTPGTHLPVIDIRKSRLDPPDYYLLLAWNYKDAIYEKEKEYLKRGGKFIMPIGESGLDTKRKILKKRSDKKVLVTGGAGYIGSVLVRRLIEEGYKVKVVDALIFTDESIKDLGNKIELINKDIRGISERDLENVWAIIHLAGFSTEPTSQYDPRLTDIINHIASEKLAVLAKRVGVERFIYPSSCSVYFSFNTPLDPPLFKESDEVNPVSCYSITKRCSEQMLLDLCDENFKPIIFRKGTAYGLSPRMRLDLVFNSFVKDAFYKRRLTVDAAGEIWRPMIDIQDIVNTYISSLKLPLEKIGGKIFNVVDENWKIGDLAIKIRDIFKKNYNLNIDMDIKPYGMSRNYKADNTLFKKTFNFKRKRSLEDTVDELYNYFKKNMNFKPEDSIYYGDVWYREFFKTDRGKRFKEYKTK